MPGRTLHIYSDGGSRGNPGPAGIGVVLCDDEDRPLAEHKEYIGRATNNEAEYRALLAGLEVASGRTWGKVLCVMDSQLVVRQLSGDYKVRSPGMARLFQEVRARERGFERVTYRQRPRLSGHLGRADELVNEALDEAGF